MGGKGLELADEEESEVVATKVVTPGVSTRVAGETEREKSNRQLLELVHASDVPRELRLRLDDVLEVMRNGNSSFTWDDLHGVMQAAANRAADLKHYHAEMVLKEAIGRGQFMTAKIGPSAPSYVIDIFTNLLPVLHGIAQSVLEADCAELRKMAAMSALPIASNMGSGGGGSGGGGSGVVGRARGRGAGRGYTTAHAPTRAPGRAPGYGTPHQSSYGGAATRHYGPVLSRTGTGRSGGRGGGGGGGGGGGPGGPGHGGGGGQGQQPLSAAEKVTIRADRLAQHQFVQQRQLQNPGNPTGYDTCRNCRAAGRDEHHMHLTCAWQICQQWCKLAGHRKSTCTNAFGPDV